MKNEERVWRKGGEEEKGERDERSRKDEKRIRIISEIKKMEEQSAGS